MGRRQYLRVQDVSTPSIKKAIKRMTSKFLLEACRIQAEDRFVGDGFTAA
jgi:hypothetical protein